MKDYDAALDLELDSMEKFVLQCLAFYQVVRYLDDDEPNEVLEYIIGFHLFSFA